VTTDSAVRTDDTAPLPPLGSTGFLRWLWRQLTSMRTALILLFLLAVVSIPGSMLPQRGTNPLRVDQWIEQNPTTAPVLDALGFFDVYAAPWFAAVYLLLFISLIGCVLPRIGVHLRALRTPPPAAPRNLSRLPAHARFRLDRPPGEVLDDAATLLRSERWRVRTSPGEWVAAEKGYWRETGNLVFHLALVLVRVLEHPHPVRRLGRRSHDVGRPAGPVLLHSRRLPRGLRARRGAAWGASAVRG